MKKIYTKQQIDEACYWLGYLQTDGGFRCDIASDGNLKPVVKLTSRSNQNILAEFKAYLESLGINGTLDKGVPATPGVSPGRGDSIRVQGKNQVGKLLAHLKGAWQTQGPGFTHPLLSYKRRNFMILERICGPEKLSIAERIGLLKSFQKANRDEPDIIADSQTKTREEREDQFHIERGLSKKAAEATLKDIDLRCLNEAKALTRVLTNINPNYWIACLDGDGGFHASVHPRHYRDSNKGVANALEWRAYISFTQGKQDLETIEAFRAYFSIPENEVTIDLSKRSGKAKPTNSYQLQLNVQSNVQKMLKFIKENGGLRGSYKKACFDVLCDLELLRKNNILYKSYKGDKVRQRQYLKKIATRIYSMNIGGSGPQRENTVETIHKLIDQFY